MKSRDHNDSHRTLKIQEEAVQRNERGHRQAGFNSPETGVELLGSYWTLGRYDTAFIFEGPDEGAIQRAMKSAMIISEFVATETLVALKREDALKLLD